MSSVFEHHSCHCIETCPLKTYSVLATFLVLLLVPTVAVCATVVHIGEIFTVNLWLTCLVDPAAVVVT